MPPANWYYKVNGEVHGPVKSNHLRQLAQAGTLRRNDTVRKEEYGDWVRASQLRGLEFSSADYDAYNEDYDPDEETFDEAPYARTRPVHRDFRYAGFGMRLAAYLIDFFITGLIGLASFMLVVVIMMVVVFANGGEPQQSQGFMIFIGLMVYLLPVIGCLIYFTGMECSKLQGTVGKLLLGIKVTDLEGNRISFFRSMGRTLSKFVSAIPLGAGFLMILFNDKQQALHDMITGCQVVEK